MLLATQLERTFSFVSKGQTIELPDPDPAMSTGAVLNFYSQTYPEMVTAKMGEPEFKDDKLAYKIETVIGSKG